MELIIRFDYGRIVPWVRQAHGGLEAIAGPDALDPAHAGRDARRRFDHCRRISPFKKANEFRLC